MTFCLARNFAGMSFVRLPLITARYASRHAGFKRQKGARKAERTLQKLFGINDDKTKKNKWEKMKSPSKPHSTGIVTVGSQRRAQQLGVYLQEHIANAFYQGEVCPMLNDYSFEVLKVKITPDFNNLNVYWNATGDIDRDSTIEELLDLCKGDLRSVLTQKNLMGRIPPINFVKDTTNAHLQLVESLLAKADMGPDHIPKELGHNMKGPDPKTAAIDRRSNRFDTFEESNIAGYQFLEGPGGTREILWHSEVEKQQDMMSKSSDRLPNHEDPKERISVDKHDLDNDKFSLDKKDEVETAVDGLLRSDIYNLDHSALSSKILHLKRKARDRDHPVMETSKERGSQGSQNSHDRNKSVTDGATLQQYLAKRKEKADKKYKRKNVSISNSENYIEQQHGIDLDDNDHYESDDDLDLTEYYQDFKK